MRTGMVLLAALVALVGCAAKEDPNDLSLGEEVGTLRASIDGVLKVFSVEKHSTSSDCSYYYNTSNPSDGALRVTGYLDEEKLNLFLGTPVAGTTWSSEQYHYLEYAATYDNAATERSSQNPGGSASMTLATFGGVEGQEVTGTFLGTLTFASGGQAVSVSGGQFTCTLSVN